MQGKAGGNGSGPAAPELGLFAVGHIRGLQQASNWKVLEGEVRPRRSPVEGLLEVVLDVGGMYPLAVRLWENEQDTGAPSKLTAEVRELAVGQALVRFRLFKSRFGELRVSGVEKVAP